MSDAAAGSHGPLAACIETIERTYEYLLAYAAQGRRDDAGTETRTTLQALHAALGGVGPHARAAFTGSDPGITDYLDAVEQDARVARGAVALVISRPRIGSLLIDNLNASVHLRALLTDVFLLDQALKNSQAE